MATDLEIKCINKSNRSNPHERITHVGGFQPDGVTRFRYEESTAIALIEQHGWNFHTYGGGRRAKVIVAQREGKKYLKTENDGIQPDNLLALPECPR